MDGVLGASLSLNLPAGVRLYQVVSTLFDLKLILACLLKPSQLVCIYPIGLKENQRSARDDQNYDLFRETQQGPRLQLVHFHQVCLRLVVHLCVFVCSRKRNQKIYLKRLLDVACVYRVIYKYLKCFKYLKYLKYFKGRNKDFQPLQRCNCQRQALCQPSGQPSDSAPGRARSLNKSLRGSGA